MSVGEYGDNDDSAISLITPKFIWLLRDFVLEL